MPGCQRASHCSGRIRRRRQIWSCMNKCFAWQYFHFRRSKIQFLNVCFFPFHSRRCCPFWWTLRWAWKAGLKANSMPTCRKIVWKWTTPTSSYESQPKFSHPCRPLTWCSTSRNPTPYSGNYRFPKQPTWYSRSAPRAPWWNAWSTTLLATDLLVRIFFKFSHF